MRFTHVKAGDFLCSELARRLIPSAWSRVRPYADHPGGRSSTTDVDIDREPAPMKETHRERYESPTSRLGDLP